MICQCFGRSFVLPDPGDVVRTLAQTARLMVGVPDYASYVQHARTAHPDQPPLTEAEFMRNRMAARYGGRGALRCC